MLEQTTLISLAMLKVDEDIKKHDYLDTFLNPFVRFVIVEHNIDPISDVEVKNHIYREFALTIPTGLINIVLKRLARSGYLSKSYGIYTITRSFPKDKDIIATRKESSIVIRKVINDISKYIELNYGEIWSEDKIIEVLTGYLSTFSIDCLKCYVNGTTIPEVTKWKIKEQFVINKYVREISNNSIEGFERFMVLVKGNMLANALTCTDLDSINKDFQKMIFYLDTPFVLRLLGFEGAEKENICRESLSLIQVLGGNCNIFQHTIKELKNLLEVSISEFNESTNDITRAYISEGKKASDLRYDKVRLERSLLTLKIRIARTPKYIERFQINEEELESCIRKYKHYYKESAMIYDINSVRSVYVLRGNTAPVKLEDTNAILLTTNSAFAKGASEYGKRFEASESVSSVITDYSIANIAWLKRPLDLDIPIREVLALSYAVLNPSHEFWQRYLEEVEKLEQDETVNKEDIQLLRTDHVFCELFELTRGDDRELTKRPMLEVVKSIKQEIKDEILKELEKEREKRDDELAEEKRKRLKSDERVIHYEEKYLQILENAKKKAAKKAEKRIKVITSCLSILIAIAFFFSNKILNITSSEWVVYKDILTVLSAILAALSLTTKITSKVFLKLLKYIKKKMIIKELEDYPITTEELDTLIKD